MAATTCRLVILAVSIVLTTCQTQDTNYVIGAGIADITGPAAGINMMGYANPGQISSGLHLRQYSRAFIVTDKSTSSSPVVFISTDSCMQSQNLKLEVIRKLKAKYGSLYTERNVCISGTNTHSGPGGFHQYLFYDITSLGFVNETLQAYVDGIVKSVDRAHLARKPGNIYVNTGELLESNINRSPAAYIRNPPEERARYEYNVDKNMTVLKMVDAEGKDIGMISWFAVHCTSMNNTNGLVSSDNKGYASQLMEKNFTNSDFPGNGKFVAAFAQANEGDVSPNTAGPKCLDTGKPCDVPTSTCNGRNEQCVAFGPGKDMFESTKIIGENQYKKAMDLYHTATIQLSGPVDFRHSYVDMTDVIVQVNATTKVKTCKTAMGYSFAAGTTDGPGAFNFDHMKGDTTGNPFWNTIVNYISAPSGEQVTCHHPKPILLDTGEISFPYAWQPSIVDVQILRIGQLAILAVPAEFTTMSGRRTRNAVTEALVKGGLPANTVSVIAGLSNDYADYVTTYEEYQQQRYEGGSTIYGPHTLEAFIQEFMVLANDMTKGVPSSPGPNPPDLISKQLVFVPPVVFDAAPQGFGALLSKLLPSYKQGTRVQAKFAAAHPRNNRRAEGTFLTVEHLVSTDNWEVVYKDSQWCTQFHWARTRILMRESEATIIWDIPADQAPGTYRLQYFGDSKSLFGEITPFSGKTPSFLVTA
ncbi:neutral ceramidase-like isoform X3 [Pecten maximus]|uniref:neutral ceramidase-like isoform X3 n=1 Tax=Pecten maximus TaxID=6579 RepID=UPI0014591309|nr:neutral ceramidase-like isoform X3 [Pecten maximus]